MTLKEKLCEPFDGLKVETVNKLEKIADDYAIEFAEWLNYNCYRSFINDWWLIKKEGDIKKTSKELLEIFKKQKGL